MKTTKYILLGIGLLLGIVLQAQTDQPYPLDTINGKVYYRYTVPRGIGIYRIGINFGVSQEELLQANPQLMTKGLRVDEVILVPTKMTVAEQVAVVEETTIIEKAPERDIVEAKKETQDKQNSILERTRKWPKRGKKAIKDSLAMVQDSISIDSIHNDSTQLDSASYVIRLAAMLPLYTDAVERDENMDRFFDFYAGSLLAINEVQQEGQKIELFSYDVDKTAHVTQELMQDSVWQKVDAIIGPAYPAQVNIATQYAQQDSTWILIPFLPNVKEIQSNPYILKFNPSTKTAAEAMATYITDMDEQVNCVLIASREEDNIPASITQLHQALKKHRVPTTTTTLRSIYTDSIDSVFVEGKENIIIFNTESYNNVQALIPNLLRASQRYQVTLFSQYSWIDKHIALPQLYTSAFSDSVNIPAAYTEAFTEYFGHDLSSEHPRYDLLGYDLTLHLLRMLQQAHQEETKRLPTDSIWQGTQTNIQYKQVSADGGYENQTIHVIRK